MRNEMTQSNQQRMHQPSENDESSFYTRTVHGRKWSDVAGAWRLVLFCLLAAHLAS
jgi:hypothetical protein